MILVGRTGYFCAIASVVTHNPAMIASRRSVRCIVPPKRRLCMLAGSGVSGGHDERARLFSQCAPRPAIPPRGRQGHPLEPKMAKTTPCTGGGRRGIKDLPARCAALLILRNSLDTSGKTPAQWHHRDNRQHDASPGTGRDSAIARNALNDISKIETARAKRASARARPALTHHKETST
jgi:hypothetical protein